jgi:HMGL-like
MFVPCKHTYWFSTVANRLNLVAPKKYCLVWNQCTTALRHRSRFSHLAWKAPASVQIVEVGPRDGLQNEAVAVSTDDKVTLITKLAAAGCSRIEVGSFVSPQWVPNMASSAEVMEGLSDLRKKKLSKLQLSCLVPSLKYLDQAIQARVDEIAIFASASEAFSQKVECVEFSMPIDCVIPTHHFSAFLV